ncbi:hypothetical protein [Pandoraea sp. NE5]|uniref:hypothetical protein n=1 Tax=Pandoraea sp. NE5 TaxID=2904129 RepID=UPI0021C2E5EA|nr:hypothetical protein [Pandoraea sp. NE5]
MDPIYVTAFAGLVGAISTCICVAITARTQTRNQHFSNQFQLTLAQEKTRSDLMVKSRETAAIQLSIAHRLLSHIEREFSVTGFNIVWTASMSVDDFNIKYMALCERFDELQMIVDFYTPDASAVCEKLYGEMNMFWGNVQNVLYLTAEGREVDHKTSCLQKAHDAAIEIGRHAASVKHLLQQSFKATSASGMISQ